MECGVKETATCGTSENFCIAARMPVKLAGFQEGSQLAAIVDSWMTSALISTL